MGGVYKGLEWGHFYVIILGRMGGRVYGWKLRDFSENSREESNFETYRWSGRVIIILSVYESILSPTQ